MVYMLDNVHVGEQKHSLPPQGSNGGRMEKVHQPEIYELKNGQNLANRDYTLPPLLLVSCVWLLNRS